MRPGWAASCTCGAVPDSFFCRACGAFAGGHTGVISVGEDFPHLTPSNTTAPDVTSEGMPEEDVAPSAVGRPEIGSGGAVDVVQRCTNGEPVTRPGVERERVLACGCVAVVASAKCLAAAGARSAILRPRHGTGH